MQTAKPMKKPRHGRGWVPRRSSASVHRRHTRHAATLAVNLLLGFEHLVEGHEAHGVAALMQAVVVQTGDLHAVDAGLLADALRHLSDGGVGHTGRLHG